MTARSPSAHGSLFVAAKAGHNGEVHNHNDVGSFIVFVGEEPVVVDAGVDGYTLLTFSDRRYELWTMQSGWHNVPVVHGCDQLPGRAHAAGAATHLASPDSASLRLDLRPAHPEQAGIVRWDRTIELDRGSEEVRIVDDWDLAVAGGSVAFSLLVYAEVVPGPPGETWLRSRGPQPVDVRVTCDPPLPVRRDDPPMGSGVLAAAWPAGLTRLRFIRDTVPRSGTSTMRIRPEERAP